MTMYSQQTNKLQQLASPERVQYIRNNVVSTLGRQQHPITLETIHSYLPHDQIYIRYSEVIQCINNLIQEKRVIKTHNSYALVRGTYGLW